MRLSQTRMMMALCRPTLGRRTLSADNKAQLNVRISELAEFERDEVRADPRFLNRDWVFNADDGDRSLMLSCSVQEAAVLAPDQMFDMIITQYTPELYAYALFETVDIVEALILSGIVPMALVGGSAPSRHSSCEGVTPATIAGWMVPPAAAWRYRGLLPSAMGQTRWSAVSALLSWKLKEFDDSMSPIRRAVAACGVDDTWVPFLRGMASYGLQSHEQAPFLPTVLEAAVKGTLQRYSIYGELRDRACVVQQLLMESAVEFGSMTMLNMALEIAVQHHLPRDFDSMLRVQQAFSVCGRKRTDHGLRASSDLSTIIARWMKEYFPRCVAIRHKSVASTTPTPSSTTAAALPSSSVVTEPLFRLHDHGNEGRRTVSSGGATTVQIWSRDELQELARLTALELEQAQRRARQHSTTKTRVTRHEGDDDAMDDGDYCDTRSANEQIGCSTDSTDIAHSDPLLTDDKTPELFFGSSKLRHGTAAVNLERETARHMEQCALAPQAVQLSLENAADALHDIVLEAAEESRTSADAVARSFWSGIPGMSRIA